MAEFKEFDRTFYDYALREMTLGATLDFVTRANSEYMEDAESGLTIEDENNELSREIHRARLDAIMAANTRQLQLMAYIDDIYDGFDMSIRLDEND